MEIIISLVKLVFFFLLLLQAVPVMVWLERRLLAWFQLRPGPNRVGPFGLLQTLADGIKLLFKESIMHKEVDVFLYLLGPFLVVFTAFAAFAAIPIGAPVEFMGYTIPLQIADLNVGLLFVFAVLSIGSYGLILAAWGSNSKYALLGGLRSTAQMISYELSLTTSALAVVVLTGTFSLTGIVNAQENVWFAFQQPLAFVIFFICTVAETNRTPFDLPEAETELVAGFHTEYSGMKFAMFFMGEYINIITVSALTVILFLGGWHLPFIDFIPGILVFGGKVGVLVLIFIWLRATFPRLRYDRLMAFGWKILLPIAILNLFGTAVFHVLMA